MKKKQFLEVWSNHALFKTFRIMKLTLGLLLVLAAQGWATKSYSQKAVLNLNMKSVHLIDVLNEIENQTDFYFLFNYEQIQSDKKMDVKASNKKIEETLDLILAGTELSYSIKDRQIVISTEKLNDLKNGAFNSVQEKTIKGLVSDSEGQPLPGVTVMVKGTTVGTITDFDGKYELANVSSDAVLVFSFIGMVSQEIVVGSQSSINIKMAADAIGIEEVVAIGYGTQKKVNLTGAVGHMSSESISSKPVTQISQALAGEISGVTVESGSGAPGRNAANITIRGLGSFSKAGTNPLVLVDGIPSSLDNINPNDVESISVLKDAASAAIYGSRAANGVILVQTKRGKAGKFTVNYSGYFGKQNPAELPEFVNSWEHAELMNEYNVNSGGSAIYTPDDIAKYKSGSDPDNYPNAQHYNDLFTSGSGMQTSHNVSFTGGDEKSRYLFSTGYLKQDGLIAENSFNRYNFLLNFDSQLSEKVELSVSLNGDVSNVEEPAHAGESNDIGAIITGAVRLPVTFPGRRSDGTYGWITEQYPEASMDSESFQENKYKHFLGSTTLKWNILDNLSLSGKVGYDLNHRNDKLYNAAMVLDANRSLGPAKLQQVAGYNSELILEALLTYEKSFKDHNFKLIAGYNQDEFYSEQLTASRDNFPNNSLYQLNAGSKDNMQNLGSAYEWSLQSVFGRLNYNYQGKYLFEMNARYDGSSRFPEKNRFGFFPSFSGAWRISEEDFIKSNFSEISNLKLRASWGSLGNQQIGNYPYQSSLTLGQDYPLGVSEALTSGAGVLILPNTNITWETTKMFDIGIDVSLFESKLDLTVDYFDKTTEDILYNISTSAMLGMAPSEVNAGEVQNKGWDFNLTHRNTIGDFSYSVNANFSTIDNKVTKLSTVDRDIANGLFVGYSLQSIYGYEADGLFVDQADIDSYPTQPFTTSPGLIRYKDIAGPDGAGPDGKVDAENDRTIIGSSFPKYNYATTLTADYKGFDVLVQLGGSGGMKRMIMGADETNLQTTIAFQNETTPQRWMVEDRWTLDDPDRNASYPKFCSALSGSGIRAASSFWLIDASYLRLRNVQLGYTLPKTLLQELGVSKLRLYVSGSNLLTFDNFYKGWDPEATDSKRLSFYPLTSVFLFGVNVTF